MVHVYKNQAELSSSVTKSATLIISFYKNLRMLELVLASLTTQSFKNFNIIICDDGSPPEIVTRVHKLLEDLSLPSIHLWHEDIGFRKNRILNWGIMHAKSDYLIFIDQDCILHPEFVAEHILGAKEKSVICGRRINLTKWASNLLTPEKIVSGFLQRNISWIALGGLFMKDNNGIKGLYFKNPFLRSLVNKKPRGIVGCNFSAYRNDLLRINGFDTRYEGAGFGEDSDVEHRLSLLGIQMQPACNTAVQYHVFHRLLDRSDLNKSLFESVVQNGKASTDFGYQQQISRPS